MNINRVFTLVSIATLASGLAGFLEAQAQKPPASTVQAEEQPPVLSVPKEYHYNTRGRRDPFVNPVPKPKETPAVAARAPQCAQPQGLKGDLVGQATIVGVVTSRDPSMTVAIIGAPGGKTYFARAGD